MGKRVTLDDLQMEPSFEYELKKPGSSEGLGIFFTICGRLSKKYSDYQRKMAADQIAKARAVKASGFEMQEPSTEDIELAAANLLAACTTGWRTDKDQTVYFNGKDHEYSHENAVALFQEPKLAWVREQIDRAVHNDANFMRASSKAS